MFWETISPESTLIQPRKTAYVWKALCNAWLVGGDDQHPSSPWKGTPVSNVVRSLDPRAQDSWCTGTASRRKCSLLCLLSCQKSLHEEKKVKEKKNQQICSLWVAWKISWPSKIVLWFIYEMGFEGYLIGCWFCVLCCQRCLLVIAVSSLPAYVYLSQNLPSHFCPPDHSE